MIQNLNKLVKTYRHINRYREIIYVLGRHGFGDFLSNLKLEKYLNIGGKMFKGGNYGKVSNLTRWERIRMVLEELGPTFIKFGQLMSNRPDLLPQPLLAELEKLQDTVPPFSTEKAKSCVEDELGESITGLFKEFTDKPVACGSIAQVHKVILNNGENAVLKIQRPGIEKVIEVDLEIMLHISLLMEKYVTGLDIINPVGIVNEFEKSITRELDFTREAAHIERTRNNFKDDETIYIPKVYKEFTTKKIISLEFIDGIKVSNINDLLDTGKDISTVTKRIIDLVLKQIFAHGFFHADPHAGNIFVLGDNVICFLDFGMTGVLLPSQRECLGNIVIGVVKNDPKIIIKALIQLTHGKRISDIEQFEYQISELLDSYSYISLKEINIGEFINEIISVVIKHKLQIPTNIYLMSKALLSMESVIRKLDPEFNLIENVKSFAGKIARENLNPYNLSKKFYISLIELSLFMRDLPVQVNELFEQARLGRFSVKFEHKGLESMLQVHDRISNRIAFSIVLASLVMGSSLIVLSGVPPVWHGIPVIGLLGFLGACVMGFWLLISIMRHGKI